MTVYYGAIKIGAGLQDATYSVGGAPHVRPTPHRPQHNQPEPVYLPNARVQDDHPLEQGFDRAYLVHWPDGGISYLVSREEVGRHHGTGRR